MSSIKEQVDRMRSVIVSKIQELPAKERFDLLRKLTVKYTHDMAVTLHQKYAESDEKILGVSLSLSEIKDIFAGRMDYPLDLQTLAGSTAEWASEVTLFITELDKMVGTSFDTHVRAHLTTTSESLDDIAKLSSFGRYENFPLFMTIDAEYQVRLAVTTALQSQSSFVLNQALNHSNEYEYFRARMTDVTFFHERSFRMKYFDRFHVNDIRNLIMHDLGALPAADGVLLVTPIFARISVLEKDDHEGEFPELGVMEASIPIKQWMIGYLEKFGNKDSQALTEERAYLEDLVSLRDRYVEAMDSILNEFKAMVGSAKMFETE